MPQPAIAIGDFSEADVPALVEIHLAAFKGYMNAGMGRYYVREFLRWFLRHPQAITLKAQLDGRPCGYVMGMPPEDHARMNHDLVWASAVGVATHPWVLFERRYRQSAMNKLRRIVAFRRNRRSSAAASAPAANEGRGISLVSVAADPACSGKGIGVALVNAFEARARAMHFDYVTLSVYADNPRARAVYEKAGWELYSPNERVVFYRKRLAGAPAAY
jgi:ribosomal protein S18 acetylase RimI-like enzyme